MQLQRGDITMTIAMICVLIFTVFLLTFRVRNRLSFVFGGGFIAVNLLIMALALYTMRISNYRYFFQFEFYIMKYLAKLKISFYDIKYVMLVSIVAFLVVMMYFFIDGASGKSFASKRIKTVFLFAASAILFVYINSNAFAENIFLYKSYYKDTKKLYFIDFVGNFVTAYSYVYILFICVLPYIRYIKEYRVTKMFYRKKYLISLMWAILFLQSLFLSILVLSPLRYFFANSNIYDIEGISQSTIKGLDYYILIITVVLLTVLGFIFIKSYVLSEVNIFKNKHNKKKANFVFKDVRHVFHTFKNLMALFLVLDNNAINNYGTKEGMESLLEIKSNILSFSERMNKILDIYNYTAKAYDYVKISDCVLDAASKLTISKNVKAKVNIECDEGIVYGDREEITEIFFNLLSNSAEAISDDGVICANVWAEGKWICTSIRDNGCGIDKKIMKKMFKPFVSSKKTFNNWGIGLSHVKDVVDAHFGFVNVKSRVSEFCEFQIILPKCNMKGGYNG